VKTELIEALGRLASLNFQRQFIIEADKNNYMLPEELLEDVDGLIMWATLPHNENQFTKTQIESLKSLREFIRKNSGEALTFSARSEVAHKISDSSVWVNLRANAASSLKEFN
jgi:hypothetical protein